MYTIIQKPVVSTNYFKGRFNYAKQAIKPDVIVIHVGVATLQGIYNTFNDPAEQKSSHYGIGELGEIWQFVQDGDNAWHAGFIYNPTAKIVKERLATHPSPNSYSIGIETSGEFAGDPTPNNFNEAQYQAHGWLVAQLAKKFNIPLDRDHIIAHHEIRYDKTCPGTLVSIERIIEIAKAANLETPVVDKASQLKKDILEVLAKY
jgi:N-acetylmuramoyl-L-alanine amidase